MKTYQPVLWKRVKKMEIQSAIRSVESDPEKLELLYQEALRGGKEAEFRSAIHACRDASPENVLFTAWYYRLQQDEPADPAARRASNWLIAIPLSILTSLIFWAISGLEHPDLNDAPFPYLILLWSPIATTAGLIYLGVGGKKKLSAGIALGLGLLAAAAYAFFLITLFDVNWKIDSYLGVAAIHIPLLSWAAIGIVVLGLKSSVEDRIAFLIKSVEVMVTAGVYLVVGMIFGGITLGMFAALSIDLPEIWLRLIAAGGFGLLPVLAVATIYDPAVPPSNQDFNQGLSRFVGTMMRLLLPLTLAVLAIYIVVIPFNFFAPFKNRDVLIVFNLMLFGIMALLLGATPVRGNEVKPPIQRWLRAGVLSVTILATLVSVYALSATVYRTVEARLTINRLTIIGWNAINIGILAALIFNLLKNGRDGWIRAMHSVFSKATNAYIVWALFLVIVLPILFL